MVLAWFLYELLEYWRQIIFAIEILKGNPNFKCYSIIIISMKALHYVLKQLEIVTFKLLLSCFKKYLKFCIFTHIQVDNKFAFYVISIVSYRVQHWTRRWNLRKIYRLSLCKYNAPRINLILPLWKQQCLLQHSDAIGFFYRRHTKPSKSSIPTKM